MLRVRNLDDQTYKEIVQAAEGRLPWLCPEWTNHNANDPGITIIELMAWYKEMQQYHLNRFTDDLCSRLLKLAGVERQPANPAQCQVEIEPERPPCPAGTVLRTREGIPFEMEEAVEAERYVLERVQVEQDGQFVEMGDVFWDRSITFQPFSAGGQTDSVLHLGFSGEGEGSIRLWFSVAPPQGAARNPFESEEQRPRVIQWQCEGAEETLLLRDETHALSVSGYVIVQPKGGWPRGRGGLRWMALTLKDPGCEEEVRLAEISSQRYRVIQRETWARTWRYRAEARAEGWEVSVEDGRIENSLLAVFIRREGRWVQTSRWDDRPTLRGRTIVIGTEGADQDGEDNVLLVSQDPAYAHTLLFDAKGLPGETIDLRLEGRAALRKEFFLLCESLHEDGTVYPDFWRCVEDLAACGPRDRVFSYDTQRESITFGNGEHGALLQRGKGAVLVAGLVLSHCDGGNIPGGRNLYFHQDEPPVWNTAASGGHHRETVEEARARLLRKLSVTEKCVSAADYERLARQTPGLRVAEAKALPAYDPDEPTGASRMLVVSVVVVPAGSGEKPMPDRRFLEAVQRQLDRVRPIGVRVQAIPPVYVEIDLSVSVRANSAEAGETLRQALSLQLYQGQAGIGKTIRVDDIFLAAQSTPGVLQVRDVTLRATSPGCYQNSYGDIQIPKQAIPHLQSLKVECLPAERLEW